MEGPELIPAIFVVLGCMLSCPPALGQIHKIGISINEANSTCLSVKPSNI